MNALRNDVETKLIRREREVQKQWENGKILEAKYNIRYKQIEIKENGPRYPRKKCLNNGIRLEDMRSLVRLRCI